MIDKLLLVLAISELAIRVPCYRARLYSSEVYSYILYILVTIKCQGFPGYKGVLSFVPPQIEVQQTDQRESNS